MTTDKKQSPTERLAAAAERQADAAEALLKLAQDDRVEVEDEGPGPSVCPHCRVANPVVTQLHADEAGSGPIDQFFIVAETHCCNRRIYAVPIAFVTTVHEDILRELLDRKRSTQ